MVMSVFAEELALNEMQFMDFINASISGTEKVLSRFSLIDFNKKRAFSLNSKIGIFRTSSLPETKTISSCIEY
jgi:hypothetical protein